MERATGEPDTPPRARQSIALLWLAAAVTGAGIIACFHGGYTEETVRAGLSWFGGRRPSFPAFAFALLGGATLIGSAAVVLPRTRDLTITRVALATMAVLIVGIVVTPYTAGPLVFAVHDTVGTLLWLTQIGWVLWVAWGLRNPVVTALATLMCASAVACLVGLLKIVPVLLWGQIAFQLCFSMAAPVAVAALHARAVGGRVTGVRAPPG